MANCITIANELYQLDISLCSAVAQKSLVAKRWSCQLSHTNQLRHNGYTPQFAQYPCSYTQYSMEFFENLTPQTYYQMTSQV